MAYVNNGNPLDEEEKKRNDAQISSNQSVLGGGGGQQAPANGTAPVSGSGSGFTNIRAYLNANKDQGEALADRISGDIARQGTEAKQGIDTLANDYGERVRRGSATLDPDLVSRASADPTNFVKNADDVNKFKSMREGNYSGPSGNFEEDTNYGKTYTAAQKAQERANLVNRESGRSALIQSLTPGMGKGKVALNQLLVGADPNSREKLSTAVKPFTNISDYLSGVSSSANAAKAQAVIDTPMARESVKTGFIDPQIPNYNNLTNSINERVAAAIAQKKVFDEQIRKQGTVDAPGGGLLEDFYYPNAVISEDVATPANISTPEEYAQILALQQLIGGDVPEYLSPTQQSLAGTYKPTVTGDRLLRTYGRPFINKNEGVWM